MKIPLHYIQSRLLIRLSFILNRFSQAGWPHYVKLGTAISTSNEAVQLGLISINSGEWQTILDTSPISTNHNFHTKNWERARIWLVPCSSHCGRWKVNLSSHREKTEIRFSATVSSWDYWYWYSLLCCPRQSLIHPTFIPEHFETSFPTEKLALVPRREGRYCVGNLLGLSPGEK